MKFFFLLCVLLLGSPDTYAAFKKAATETSAVLPANTSLSTEAVITSVLSKNITSARQQRKTLRRALWAGFKNTFHRGPNGGKSQLVALLLCIFLGGLGIHRFYLGYTAIGFVQLLVPIMFSFIFLIALFIAIASAASVTVVFGIFPLLIALGYFAWILIDLVRIAIGSLQPKNGTYEKTL